MGRVLLTEEPFTGDAAKVWWFSQGDWPAQWIDLPGGEAGGSRVTAFRLRFTAEEAGTARVHVSADNRYRLFLDGMPVGRGPERGDVQHWCYETYDLTLAAGEHVLTAQTWWFGQRAPFAQMSLRPGFLLAAEGVWHDRLTTGTAPWEAMPINGITYLERHWHTFFVVGPELEIDGASYPWGFERGEGEGWAPAQQIGTAMSITKADQFNWSLTPATLPPMLEEPRPAGVVRHLADTPPTPVDPARHLAGEAAAWQAWITGGQALTIPAHTTRTAIIALDDYYCAYPRLTVSGGQGARIRLDWAEALYQEPQGEAKGQRDAVDGKYFRGAGDTFLPDGGAARQFSTVWWHAGRFLALSVTTGEAPLTLEAFDLLETRYPLAWEGHFRSDDAQLAAVLPPALRTLQMCAHETYMDCPYYEQLMYVGDTRLEVLVTYTLTRDDRLPRKALRTFDASRRPTGLTQSRYPSSVAQCIPPFSLWWVCMVYDFHQWRDDSVFVRGLLPGTRAVLEYYRTLLRPDGLLHPPQGWNFVDWVPDNGWHAGIPPHADREPNGTLHFQVILALLAKADMEAHFDEPLLAQRDRAWAEALFAAVQQHFWDEARGLFAEDLAREHFSEHAQCLAILSGLLPAAQQARVVEGLTQDASLARTTIYFTHYLFETYARLGRIDLLFRRLELWYGLNALGVKTLLESPEPSRSDCHAWAAHPLYQCYATLLGVRPAAPGFQRVRIAPQPGPLTALDGALPHPQGTISVRLRRDGNTLHATVTLPDATDGVFVWQGQEVALRAGEQTVVVRGS